LEYFLGKSISDEKSKLLGEGRYGFIALVNKTKNLDDESGSNAKEIDIFDIVERLQSVGINTVDPIHKASMPEKIFFRIENFEDEADDNDENEENESIEEIERSDEDSDEDEIDQDKEDSLSLAPKNKNRKRTATWQLKLSDNEHQIMKENFQNIFDSRKENLEILNKFFIDTNQYPTIQMISKNNELLLMYIEHAYTKCQFAARLYISYKKFDLKTTSKVEEDSSSKLKNWIKYCPEDLL